MPRRHTFVFIGTSFRRCHALLSFVTSSPASPLASGGVRCEATRGHVHAARRVARRAATSFMLYRGTRNDIRDRGIRDPGSTCKLVHMVLVLVAKFQFPWHSHANRSRSAGVCRRQRRCSGNFCLNALIMTRIANERRIFYPCSKDSVLPLLSVSSSIAEGDNSEWNLQLKIKSAIQRVVQRAVSWERQLRLRTSARMEEQRYAFVAEWYDAQAALVRRFHFLFFPRDNSVEMVSVTAVNRVPFTKNQQDAERKEKF